MADEAEAYFLRICTEESKERPARELAPQQIVQSLFEGEEKLAKHMKAIGERLEPTRLSRQKAEEEGDVLKTIALQKELMADRARADIIVLDTLQRSRAVMSFLDLVHVDRPDVGFALTDEAYYEGTRWNAKHKLSPLIKSTYEKLNRLIGEELEHLQSRVRLEELSQGDQALLTDEIASEFVRRLPEAGLKSRHSDEKAKGFIARSLKTTIQAIELEQKAFEEVEQGRSASSAFLTQLAQRHRKHSEELQAIIQGFKKRKEELSLVRGLTQDELLNAQCDYLRDATAKNEAMSGKAWTPQLAYEEAIQIQQDLFSDQRIFELSEAEKKELKEKAGLTLVPGSPNFPQASYHELQEELKIMGSCYMKKAFAEDVPEALRPPGIIACTEEAQLTMYKDMITGEPVATWYGEIGPRLVVPICKEKLQSEIDAGEIALSDIRTFSGSLQESESDIMLSTLSCAEGVGWGIWEGGKNILTSLYLIPKLAGQAAALSILPKYMDDEVLDAYLTSKVPCVRPEILAHYETEEPTVSMLALQVTGDVSSAITKKVTEKYECLSPSARKKYMCELVAMIATDTIAGEIALGVGAPALISRLQKGVSAARAVVRGEKIKYWIKTLEESGKSLSHEVGAFGIYRVRRIAQRVPKEGGLEQSRLFTKPSQERLHKVLEDIAWLKRLLAQKISKKARPDTVSAIDEILKQIEEFSKTGRLPRALKRQFNDPEMLSDIVQYIRGFEDPEVQADQLRRIFDSIIEVKNEGKHLAEEVRAVFKLDRKTLRICD